MRQQATALPRSPKWISLGNRTMGDQIRSHSNNFSRAFRVLYAPGRPRAVKCGRILQSGASVSMIKILCLRLQALSGPCTPQRKLYLRRQYACEDERSAGKQLR